MKISCGISGWFLAMLFAFVLARGPAARADDTLAFMSLIDRLSAAEEKQNYDEAFRLGDQAVKLINGSQQLRGSEFEVVALARIGLLHFSQGNLTVAEQQMRRALDVTEKLPNGGQLLPVDQIVTPLLLHRFRRLVCDRGRHQNGPRAAFFSVPSSVSSTTSFSPFATASPSCVSATTSVKRPSVSPMPTRRIFGTSSSVVPVAR